MARLTDTERGACIARDAAVHALHPDLFGYRRGDLGQWDGAQLNDFWRQILHVADLQLDECRAPREALV